MTTKLYKIMKNSLISVCIIAFILSTICFFSSGALTARAVETGNTSTTHLKMEKNVFVEGEPILVTPTGAGKDWVGIVDVNDMADGEYPSLKYRYITDNNENVDKRGFGSGATVDVKEFYTTPGGATLTNLPAGNYGIIYVTDDQNAMAHSEFIPITIVKDTVRTEHLTLEKTAFYEGEPILVTPTGTGTDWVGLVSENCLSTASKWRYITYSSSNESSTGLGSGVAFDLVGNAYTETTHASAKLYKGVQAGKYKVVYVPNNGNASTATESIEITVYPRRTLQTAHMKMEKNTFSVGESIMVTPTVATANAGDWVAITKNTSDSLIRWKYIDVNLNDDATHPASGAGSGVAINMRAVSVGDSSDKLGLNSIPAGEYKIAFIPNDKSLHFATEVISITVKETSLEAPSNVTMNLSKTKGGLYAGQITVDFGNNYANLTGNSKPTDIVMYWADESGVKLSDYSALARRKVTGKVTTFNTYDGVLIPLNARKLLVYSQNSSGSLSSEAFSVDIPEEYTYKNNSKLVTELQIVSDIHVDDDPLRYGYYNFSVMLEDIGKNSPNSSGIMVVGDMTDCAKEWQYQFLETTYKEYKTLYPNLPEMFLTLGNHDFMNFGSTSTGTHYDNSAYNARISMYKKYASKMASIEFATTDKAYYDTFIDGVHYIFLASDSIPAEDGGKSYISNAQLTWLKTVLEKDRSGKPIFIFVHQPLVNTVGGSHATPGVNNAHGYMGILSGDDYAKYQNASYGDYATRCLLQEQALRNILKDYPEVCLFTGHTHWWFDSPYTMVRNVQDLPITMFNTSAVGYLWQDYNKSGGEHLDGNQGYYVRIYEDRMEVLGRNFDKGNWVSSAQFVINFSEMHQHDFSYDIGFDETGHYGVCECGEADLTVIGHSFTNGECSCGYVDPNYSVGDGGNTGSGDNTGDNTGSGSGGGNDNTGGNGSSSDGTGGGNDTTDGENNTNGGGGISCTMGVNGNDLIIPTVAILSAMTTIYLINRRKRKNG